MVVIIAMIQTQIIWQDWGTVEKVMILTNDWEDIEPDDDDNITKTNAADEVNETIIFYIYSCFCIMAW